jgi:signal transduction histidine kinase
MTLKNRIALIFALANLTLLVLIFISLYVLTRRYTHTEFFDRLEDRATLAVQALLEKDEIAPQTLLELSRRRMRTLIKEQEFIISLDSSEIDLSAVPRIINRSLLNEIVKDGTKHFRDGNSFGVGIRYQGPHGNHAIIVTAEDFYGQRKLNNLLKLMSLFLVVSIAVVFLAGRWYAWHILKPIGRMVRSMKDINSSNLHLRLKEEEESKDELGQLAETFNRLLDRIEAAVETQNLFVGHASHELKNPLTAILGQVEAAIQSEQLTEPTRQSLKIISEEATRLNSLLQKFISLSYPDDGAKASWRFDELIFDVVEEFKQTHPHASITIDFVNMPATPEKLSYRGSYQLLRIAIFNLVENAVKFSQNEEVRLKADFQDNKLTLEVTDKGIGISPENQPHIFSAFYRAENVRGFPGYGIGLSLVEKIVKMHNGKLSVKSELGKGSTFTIGLPF